MLQPGRWQVVWRHVLDPDEAACSLSTQRLRSAATGEQEPFIAVGTALGLGEDYPCTGRVLLFRMGRSAADAAPSATAAAYGWTGELVASRQACLPLSKPCFGPCHNAEQPGTGWGISSHADTSSG